jgi:hypothetical protein
VGIQEVNGLGRVEFKVPGGKLIAAEAEAEGGRIVRVKITGDFFMHPEEAIEELEVSLTGVLREQVDRTHRRCAQGLRTCHKDEPRVALASARGPQDPLVSSSSRLDA